MMRLTHIFIAYLLIASTTVTGYANQLDEVSVTINATRYIGQHNQSLSDVHEFLGIPFAQPPIDSLRWQAPQKITQIASEYRSQEFKPACYQDRYNPEWYEKVASLFGQNIRMDLPPVSEDCLYLNIWKPADVKHDDLAVIVWIHGGSNKAGWSYEPNYLGHQLAQTGNVIVVSIAYRLGVFGFFPHPELQQRDVSPNFALLDQIMALEWIHEHISAFGGDPNNVTLMGESAGAANIGYLMSIPRAKGLFKRAISQSGGFQMMASSELRDDLVLGHSLSHHFNKDLSQLKTLSSESVWQAASQIAPNYDYRALIDGDLFTESAPTAFKKYAAVDLLIGFNQHEFYMYVDPAISQAHFALPITDPQNKAQLDKKYQSFSNHIEAQDWLDTFLYMSCPSAMMAKLVGENGKQAWMYRFDRIRAGASKIKAYHGAEIPYVFNTHDNWLPTSAIDIQLTETMMNAWIRFAQSGNPN